MKLNLPGTSVRFAGAFIGMVNCTVCHFVNVRNQKGVGVQVGVDRDVGGAVGKGAKIAEAAAARPDDVKPEWKLLLKLLAVAYSRRRYVLGKLSNHSGIKTEKPHESRAFSRLPEDDRDYFFVVSAGATTVVAAAAVAAESTTAAAESTTAAAESITAAVESTAASSVFGLLSQAANVRTLPTNRRAITFFMNLSRWLKISDPNVATALIMCNIDAQKFS